MFSEYNGVYRAQLLGPRVSPAAAPFRKGEYFWGIVLHGEVSLADHSKKALLNKSIELPLSSDNTLILNGHKLPLPAYEALEDFTDTLIKANLLAASPIAAVSHRDKLRKLKTYIGLTPKQIEQAARVDAAIAPLARPLTLTQIASRTGFADHAHMTRDFKRFVGMSPTEARAYFDE